MRKTLRLVLGGAVAATILAAGAIPRATAEEAQQPQGGDGMAWRTVSSLIGPTKYDAGFPHYDYVTPDAPKGGTLNGVASGTFDSFNPYIVRGSPAAGLAQFGGGLLYDTLMEQATDEPGVSHPMVAELGGPSAFLSLGGVSSAIGIVVLLRGLLAEPVAHAA